MKEPIAYEFGPFRLEVAERRLLRQGEPVTVTAKVFDLLLLLVRNGGHLVRKEEISAWLWPDHVVEENNLTVSMSLLRRALSEGRQSRRHIETIPKEGYRFVAPVKAVNADAASAQGAAPRPAAVEGGLSEREGPIRSLAVLPLVNAGDDPELEYLSDGITESIINNLAQLPRLKVMARSTVFRHKVADVDPLEAGRIMRVKAVLVSRMTQEGDHFVVVTELVDTHNGAQLWAGRFTPRRSQLLEMQEEIAREISRGLRLRLTGAEQKQLRKRHTENAEAYQLYLQGRYFWGKYTGKGVEKAIDFFSRAAEEDPRYALAYTGIAQAYYRLSNQYLPPAQAMPKVEAAARKALDIDADLGEAHTLLGVVKALYNYDWTAARKRFQRGVELEPGNPFTRSWYGWIHTIFGRFEPAVEEFSLTLKLDPLSLQARVALAGVFTLSGAHDEAIEGLKRVIEMDPYYWPARGVLGDAYTYKGIFSEAVSELKLALSLEDNPQLVGRLGYVYAVTGRRRDAEEMLSRLRAASESRYASPYYSAIIYAGLGEKEQALRLLEETYEDRSESIVLLKVDPKLDSLRSEPVFNGLLRHLGLQP